MRNIVFRFDDPMSVAQALGQADQELPVPAGEIVKDGEWVLAVFEVGAERRTTAAAARGQGTRPGAGGSPEGAAILSFERRDWERLVEFAQACSEGGEEARPIVPPDPPTQPSLGDSRSARPPPSSGEASSGRAIKAPRSRKSPGGSPPVSGTAARVLLVDDQPMIGEAVRRMLAPETDVDFAYCADPTKAMEAAG